MPFCSPSDPEFTIIAMLHIENIGCGPLPWGGIARYQEVGIAPQFQDQLDEMRRSRRVCENSSRLAHEKTRAHLLQSARFNYLCRFIWGK